MKRRTYKIAFAVGGVIVVAGCLGFYFLSVRPRNHVQDCVRMAREQGIADAHVELNGSNDDLTTRPLDSAEIRALLRTLETATMDPWPVKWQAVGGVKLRLHNEESLLVVISPTEYCQLYSSSEPDAAWKRGPYLITTTALADVLGLVRQPGGELGFPEEGDGASVPPKRLNRDEE